jgi:hypothetical protein
VTGADKIGPAAPTAGEAWRKTVEKDNLLYEFNIVKTDSIVSPYMGTYSYTLVQYITSLYPTKEAAFKSSDLVYTKSITHTLTYKYEGGRWVFKSDDWEQSK